MPTEHDYIDVRDLFARINPNGLDEKDLARDGASFVEPHTINDYHLFRAGYQAALEAQQGQGESIRLTAVATLEEDGDGGLEPNWLLEGGTAELFAGMTLLVADNALHLCDDDGSAQVYTHADPAEVDQLRRDLHAAKVALEARARTFDTLRAQLVELNALLRDWVKSDDDMGKECSIEGTKDACYRYDDALARAKSRLSASVEPSAPVEIDERAEFERAFVVQEGVFFSKERNEYRSMNGRTIEETDSIDLNLRLSGWQARATLERKP